MASFGDSGIAGGSQRGARPSRRALRSAGLPEGKKLLGANLYGVSELIAARAARPSRRRQYGATYRRS